MSANPFAGTELEQPFQDGFTAGFISPDADNMPPSPFPLDVQDAYAEGVVAGRKAMSGMAVPPTPPPDKPGTWEDLAHIGEIVADAAHTGVKVFRVAGTAAKLAFGLAGALEIFVSVAIFGPDRSEPFFDEAATLALSRVKKELEQEGLIADNIELFMAACDRTDHAVSDLDELTRQGFFHGSVFVNFDEALAEGQAHVHPGDTRVLRFQTTAPNMIEVIELDTTS
jgi:hypothetical protein